MTKSEKDRDLPRPEGQEPGAAEKHDAARRAALLKMGGLAASVAPAMLVLTSGKASARPSCDNPAWDLGLNRAGHSGC